ncbi:MAG: hypothetical protein E6767_20075 [Dysgonomonas sp.]|nr:hypothetical protein [Dysgonomonas sp.]
MNLKAKLSTRIGIDDINDIVRIIHSQDNLKQELYELTLGEDEAIGYQAAWIFTHFSSQDNKWLYDKQNELIDEVLICNHAGKRRLLLNLLYKQPLSDPLRVDFLDFCLVRMISNHELPGVQSLCMKIAYELCRTIPELTQELKVTLEMMEGDLCPAIRTVKRNILKAMLKGKSLQKF